MRARARDEKVTARGDAQGKSAIRCDILVHSKNTVISKFVAA